MVCITEFEPPTHFADVMVRGVFRRMQHHHYFERSSEGTVMRDLFSYEAPLGILGRIAELLFLNRYMRSLLVERNRVIKETAESGAWTRFLRG